VAIIIDVWGCVLGPIPAEPLEPHNSKPSRDNVSLILTDVEPPFLYIRYGCTASFLRYSCETLMSRAI
jgi:hypothetical protein